MRSSEIVTARISDGMDWRKMSEAVAKLPPEQRAKLVLWQHANSALNSIYESAGQSLNPELKNYRKGLLARISHLDENGTLRPERGRLEKVVGTLLYLAGELKGTGKRKEVARSVAAD